jgi:glutamyl-tRNA(Gln) amidotransferase subunit E
LDYKFKEEDFRFVLENLEKKKINKEAAFDILHLIAEGKKVNLKKYEGFDISEVEEEIKKIVEKNKDLSIGAIMGVVMGKYRGKIDGKTASEIVRKYKN